MLWGADGIGDERGLGESPVVLDDIWDGGATVTARVNLNDFGIGQSFSRLLNKAGWQLGINDISGLRFSLQMDFSGTNGGWLTPVGAFSLSTWTNLAVTYNSDSVSNVPAFYVDGVLVTTAVDSTPTGTRDTDAAGDMTFGNRDVVGERCIDGQIVDLRLYSRELDASEIADISTLNGDDSIVDGLISQHLLNGVLTQSPGSEFGGRAITTAGSSTTIAATSPSGVVEGDRLLLVLLSAGSGTTAENITTPSGWTLANSGQTDLPAASTRPSIWVFDRAAPSSPPSTYTVTGDQTASKTTTIIRAPRVGSLDVASSINTGTSNAPVAPSITAGGPAYCLRIVGMDGNGRPTYPPDFVPDGLNHRSDAAGGVLFLSVEDEMVSAGSTGTKTFAASSSLGWGALTITWDAPSGEEPGALRDLGPNGLHMDVTGNGTVLETELMGI